MLSNLQELLERSIFEQLRLVLVAEGYLPDITDNARYPFVNDLMTATAQANWDTDLATIKAAKGFAIELFGYSSSDAKGTKKVPRITIETARSMPSEIGAPMDGIYMENPENNATLLKQALPFRASNFDFDIHLVANTARQIRVLNAVLGKALDRVKFIPYLTLPAETFFIEQFNYFDIPDTIEGIEEKVYSYRVPDLYDVKEEALIIPKMREITIQTELLRGDASINDELTVQGIHTVDGHVRVTKENDGSVTRDYE